MQLEGKAGLSITEACQCARLGRSRFYRHFEEHFPRQADTELRGQIQQICLENRCYGSRRVARELREQGRVVNRKRVIRLMQADNLLCLRKRRYVCTTDSRHTYAVYPNLTRDWKPNDINQLWVADITYIRLRESFLYLAVVLDAYSRKVIGWALDNHLRGDTATGYTDSPRRTWTPPGLDLGGTGASANQAPASRRHHNEIRAPLYGFVRRTAPQQSLPTRP